MRTNYQIGLDEAQVSSLAECADARVSIQRNLHMISRLGEVSGINRIYRLYREEGLRVRKRKARGKAIGTTAPILMEARANARWSLDLVHD